MSTLSVALRSGGGSLKDKPLSIRCTGRMSSVRQDSRGPLPYYQPCSENPGWSVAGWGGVGRGMLQEFTCANLEAYRKFLLL